MLRPVDHVYILTTVRTEKVRLPALFKELKRIGMIQSLDDPFVSVHYGIKPRLYEFILQNTPLEIDSILVPDPHAVSNQYSCTMAHYRIMQEALERGFDRVMIIEDDERFLKDADQVKSCLDGLPSDLDLLLLDWLPVFESNHYTSGAYAEHMKKHEGKRIIPLHPFGLFGNSGCTIKSRICLSVFQDLMDSAYYPLNKRWTNSVKPIDRWQDQGVLGQFGIKSYQATPRLCIQSCKSEIQGAEVADKLKDWYSKSCVSDTFDMQAYTE